MSDGAERRQHPRKELISQTEVSFDGEMHILTTINVSLGGAFLAGDSEVLSAFGVATHVDLCISALGNMDRDITVRAQVVRVSPGGPGNPAGIAVKFEELSAENLDTLLRMMAD